MTETISLTDDGAGVRQSVPEITGDEVVESEPDQEDYYLVGTMHYDWSAVHVFMGSAEDMTYASVSISAPQVGGVPVRTVEGISVGSSRGEAIAAGARDGFDSDDDGVADELHIGRQEVPGTQSYLTDDVGILFVNLRLEGDVVSSMSSAGNDFRDI